MFLTWVWCCFFHIVEECFESKAKDKRRIAPYVVGLLHAAVAVIVSACIFQSVIDGRDFTTPFLTASIQFSAGYFLWELIECWRFASSLLDKVHAHMAFVGYVVIGIYFGQWHAYLSYYLLIMEMSTIPYNVYNIVCCLNLEKYKIPVQFMFVFTWILMRIIGQTYLVSHVIAPNLIRYPLKEIIFPLSLIILCSLQTVVWSYLIGKKVMKKCSYKPHTANGNSS